MNCKRCERWISDDLDGRLPLRRKRSLERHLESCSSCRAYHGELHRLQNEASRLLETDREPAFWEGFNRRLGIKLAAESSPPARRRPASLRRRWAWAGAAALVLAVLGIRHLMLRTPLPPERLPLSHEESLAVILGEIETDPDLARTFSEHIEASLRETAGLDTLELPPRFRDDPFFWESLSDEELASLERELQTQYRLTEVSHEVF